MSLSSTFVPVVRLKAELFSSLDVGMLSRSFFPFRSLAPSLCLFSLFLFLFPLSRALLLLPPRARQRQEHFLLSHGCILSGISHIHHVITVIFSALRHVALSFLLFDPFEARTLRKRNSRRICILAITLFGNCDYAVFRSPRLAVQCCFSSEQQLAEYNNG